MIIYFYLYGFCSTILREIKYFCYFGKYLASSLSVALIESKYHCKITISSTHLVHTRKHSFYELVSTFSRIFITSKAQLTVIERHVFKPTLLGINDNYLQI